MERLIDIHCHILPAVDNGSVSMDQTKRMLKIAYEEGITYIIATPHYGAGCVNTGKLELEDKLEQVRRAAKEIDTEFQIELGNELYYSQDIAEHLRKGKARTLANTRYCLVKFPEDEEYALMRAGLHSLLVQGYYPVLSHVEGYRCFYENYEDIARLINLGVYMQMNIRSLTGNSLDPRVRFARRLMAYGMVHFIGTGSRSDYTQSLHVRKGLAFISRGYGEEVKRTLLENTNKLLLNRKIERKTFPYV
ncbi:CpsB/CapC family capsule biosynthesis tyrosine phosphatase [Anaerocolumna xylanovorans]|uniref:protein-tyrosine-phosphatase n=1 Tax=Anaerocolumna xylanovorans DSM 12503 TaxID=1121345 RepID=A0A1M7YAC3_9FIRM|nr:CpsB/CapC family capsule biosynthesis tyrosine phosphatase [Anaerocolumna xylanovorans]SHO49549.1 protein-tyrosine phosphatase [Anaerocolumna xylanovorans DSM 12503]